MYVSSVQNNVVSVIRARNSTTATTHNNGDTVLILVDFSVHVREQLPTCDFSCTTQYELYSPNECTDLDWECGHEVIEQECCFWSLVAFGENLLSSPILCTPLILNLFSIRLLLAEKCFYVALRIIQKLFNVAIERQLAFIRRGSGSITLASVSLAFVCLHWSLFRSLFSIFAHRLTLTRRELEDNIEAM